MRVLLISPNREKLPDPVFPIGLAYIASALRREGHEVQAVDFCFSPDPAALTEERIREFRPDVVGLSLRNVDDVSFPKKHSYIDEYAKAVRMIRKQTDAPLVLGGSGFTIMPGAFMEKLGADYGIAGEGEKAFPDLLRSLAGERPARNRRIIRPSSRQKCLDALRPDRSLFDNDSYYKYGGMLNIQTKRGCPFRCIYCTYPKIEGKTPRMRSPVSVAEEIEEVQTSTGASHFFFVDSIFNYPRSHALAICREISRRRLDIRWSCYAHPRFFDSEMASAMADAGCTGVEFGADSLNDQTLSLLGKDFNFSHVKRASEACRSSGLKFCHFVFAGAPGEDLDGAKSSLARLEELDPDAAVIMTGIRIFPGTPLAKRAQDELGITDAGLEPVFYISPGLEEKLEELAEEISTRRRWIMPGFEVNIHPRLQSRLRERGIKGSLWEELSRRSH